MTRSIACATLLAAALAGCAKKPAEPPPVAAAPVPGPNALISYCGPVWSIDRQGYVQVPCPAGTNYDTLR